MSKNGIPSTTDDVSDLDYKEILEKYNRLAQSEKKYRLLVENGGDGIVVVQNEKVKFVNKEMLGLLRIDNRKLQINRTLSLSS